MKEKILILGGTEFVGRLLVEALLKDEQKEVVLFNRGKTNPDLFPTLQKIIGDRETDDIEQITAHKWDYIVDFSSYYPKSLQKTLEQINRDVIKYIYISTISVYDFSSYDLSFKIKEDFKQVTCSPEEAVDKTMKTYGKKKAACEAVLAKADWLNTVVLRPSVIYGKYDPTDRFYYWMKKIKTNDKIIIPNNGNNQLTLTYANDLVDILLTAIKGDLATGTYNCSTHQPLTFRHILDTIKDTVGSNCQWQGMDVKKLREQKVGLPLAFVIDLLIDNERIKAASGLEFTPFEESVKSMVAYYEKEGWHPCSTGIDDETEQALIQKTTN